MASSKPRIGYDNLLWRNRLHLRATTEATGHPVENLADWTGGRYWKPTIVSNPPATEYVYVYPLNEVDATSGKARLEVLNWYFRDWSLGAAAAPDNHTKVGAGSSVARSATAKIDLYSAELTRAGTNCYLSQSLTGWEPGKKVTKGHWVNCGTADRARVSLVSDAGSTSSAYHAGTSAWVWLEVTHEVEHDATTLEFRLEVNDGDVAALFGGGAAYLGAEIDPVPHAAAVDYLAIYDHNAGSGDWTVSVEWSADPGDWSSPTALLSIAPTNDRSAWKDATSASKTAWRVKFTPDAGGSPQLFCAVLSIGFYLELPEYFWDGWDPNFHELHSETLRASGGVPIQRGVRRKEVRMKASLPWIAESYTKRGGSIALWWDHAGDTGSPGGLPFFLQWDDGDHETYTLYCQVPDGGRYSAPMAAGLAADRFEFDLVAVAE